MSCCTHPTTHRIGEIGGRFQDEWCPDCGALRSWDNYVEQRETAKWVKPRLTHNAPSHNPGGDSRPPS